MDVRVYETYRWSVDCGRGHQQSRYYPTRLHFLISSYLKNVAGCWLLCQAIFQQEWHGKSLRHVNIYIYIYVTKGKLLYYNHLQHQSRNDFHDNRTFFCESNFRRPCFVGTKFAYGACLPIEISLPVDEDQKKMFGLRKFLMPVIILLRIRETDTGIIFSLWFIHRIILFLDDRSKYIS